jgi:micrococcal nuclease
MSRLAVAVAVLGALALPGAAGSSPLASEGIVASVADGDTLTLTSGSRIRLLQIDAPEVGQRECYAASSRRALLGLTPVGTRVALQTDPALDRVDRHGRLLRYVRRGSLEVNLELVRRGAAAPYFYGGERGRYASRLLVAAVGARARGRGLWGASPQTRLDPYRQVDTGTCRP